MVETMRIATRIFGGFGVALALLAGLVSFSVWSMNRVQSELADFAHTTEQTEAVIEAGELLSALRISQLDYAMRRDPADRATVENNLAALTAFSTQGAQLFPHDAETLEREMVGQIGPLAAAYRESFETVVGASEREASMFADYQRLADGFTPLAERLDEGARQLGDLTMRRLGADFLAKVQAARA